MEHHINFDFHWKTLRYKLIYSQTSKLKEISIITDKLLRKIICPKIKQDDSLHTLHINLLQQIRKTTTYLSTAATREKRQSIINQSH